MKIQLQNITTKKDKLIHDNLSVSFSAGFNVITGDSGTGKTTLLRIILGLEKPDSGKVEFLDNDGNIISQQNGEKFSWIPQKLIGTSGLTLSEFLEDLNIPWETFLSESKQFYLNFYSDKSIEDTSEGEMQRILITIARIQNRPILIADEPSSALDSENRKRLIEFLKNYNGTVICVSHEDEFINSAHKVFNLSNGAINESHN